MQAVIHHSIDDFAFRDKEACSEMAVAEQQDDRCQKNAESKKHEHGRGEPGPYGQRQPRPEHSCAAPGPDGSQQADSMKNGSNAEDANTDEPQVHSRGLTWASGRNA